MPAAELDQLLEPVLAGRRARQKVFAPSSGGANSQPPTTAEPIAEGFEEIVRQRGKDQAGTVRAWDERRLVVRERELRAAPREVALASASIVPRRRSQRAGERKQGKPILRSIEEAHEATERITEAHRVREDLRIKVHRTVQARTKRRDGDRPATTLQQEHFTVQSTVEQKALEEAIRRLGWRVYATNQPAHELALAQAVWASSRTVLG